MASSACTTSLKLVRLRRGRGVTAVMLGGTLAACATLPGRPSAGERDAPLNAFARHLDRTIPSFLEDGEVPGASLALVRNGEVVLLRAYGLADRDRRRPVTPDTRFNVGSISKTVTAWGVMRLVARGRVALDDPVERYLRRWHLPASQWSPDGVTIRRLLSHTAGLSLPSVREFRAGEPTPSLATSLADSTDGVRQLAGGGSGFRYSGGGYEVLQLLIEDVTGRPFADWMRDEVLVPLGMRRSTFDTLAVPLRLTATPYDSGRAIPSYHYVGLAAAGLYATAEDLGRFVAAWTRGPHGEPPGRGVLSATTVATMQTPAPSSASGYGFFYGLGYNLFPLGNTLRPDTVLGDGALAPGHMGQNTGWGAVTWLSPSTGDGFVMLTNHSAGFEAYRWALCDWVRWAALPSFGYICNGRERHALGVLGETLYAAERDASTHVAFIDTLARAVAPDSAPGVAVLVVRDGRVMHSAGYGRADLATRRRITPETPFYLASISKQLTARAVMRLARAGVLSYDDPVSRFVPELGSEAGAATVRHLLTHSAGIQNYYDFLKDWSRLARFDNAAVIDSLRGKPLDFAPGTRSKYSNSGYVVLATILERAAKRPFAELMSDLVFEPAGMKTAVVVGPADALPGQRAIGYDSAGGRFTLSDYGAFEGANGRRVYVDMRTVGAGGVYASLRDLAAWVHMLDSLGRVDPSDLDEAFGARVPADDVAGVDSVRGYGYGWVVSRRYDSDVVWHDGAFGGFRNVVLYVPSQRLSVVVLSNGAWIDQRRLAVTIADRLQAEPRR